MSPSKQKVKGSSWERLAAKELSNDFSNWKRVPGSGALGTNLNLPELTGDIHGVYPFFKKHLKAEGKFGYGSSKSIRIQREWVTKIREQAKIDNKYPCLIFKFENVTGGDLESAKMIAFNLDVWNSMMTDVNDIYEQYLKLLEKDYNEKTQPVST